MIMISEWLPNPIGKDAAGEFVELFNTNSEPVNLAGYTILTKGKKKIKISGMISARGYASFTRAEAKIALRNTDEGIALYDAHSHRIDESSFIGTAQEGKSLSRNSALMDSVKIGKEIPFVWGVPTPGKINKASASHDFEMSLFSFNAPINAFQMARGNVMLVMLGVAVLLTTVVLYSIRTHENLSDIFFS